jgi:hypothetical protein
MKNDNYKEIPNKKIKETLVQLNTLKELSEHKTKTFSFSDSKYDSLIESYLMDSLTKPPIDPLSITKNLAILEEKYSFIKGYRFDFVDNDQSIIFLKLLK